MNAGRRVAITGMGILSALGDDFPTILARMKDGLTGIAPVEKFDTEKLQCRIAAEIKYYDPQQYFTKQEADQFDLCAQYAIVSARKALEDAGIRLDPDGRKSAGVALGTCNGGMPSLEAQWTLDQLNDKETARYPYYQQGDHVAEYFGLQGPVVTMNTACAASGNAIGFAYDMIRNGYADTMLAGGSDPLSHVVYAGFHVLRALNPEPTSPFGQNFGLSLGEGAAFVVLEPLDAALRRGAKIYAELCGYGLSNDAYHATASEPEGRGIKAAVEMALRDSGLSGERIGYINAHGTGTKANDRAEAAALKSVFGEQGIAGIPISSSKAYFGHTLGAAAAIELTTALYAIGQGWLPATLHFDSPREGCEGLDMVANQMRPGSPDVMLCNNSAFGGHNVSLITRKPERFEETRSSSLAERKPSSETRIGIVGMGMVCEAGLRKGPLWDLLAAEPAGERAAAGFSLKEFDPDLYERRMNPLCQYSIAASRLAMEDAAWSANEDDGKEIGLIYGTSRGSLDSISRYLGSIYEQGPEFASSIYFPFNVINSTAGKVAEKLRLRGFSSSFSTGGNEGLLAALYGAETIRSRRHNRCLVGAGDEHSELSARIDQAKQLNARAYSKTEGSGFLAIENIDTARQRNVRIYAEIKGFGIGFGGAGAKTKRGMRRAVSDAMRRSRLAWGQLDFILLNSIGRAGETEQETAWLRALMPDRTIPIVCLNGAFGYGESLSSLAHLYAAAELVFASFPAPGMPDVRLNGMAVSSSVNGNSIAAVMGRYEPSSH